MAAAVANDQNGSQSAAAPQRLDMAMVARGLVATRSQAESWIRLGRVMVGGRLAIKPGTLVGERTNIVLNADEQYVSRAGLKLASAAAKLALDFCGKTVLDVGSSTGGFTDFALKHGACRVIAVDVGTGQMHPIVRADARVELHEQTDIRALKRLSASPDIVVIDVSFISLRDVLPHIATLSEPQTVVVAMVKPQFEATAAGLKHKGVIKNDHMRRDILKDFETWTHGRFIITAKADSEIAGAKGNLERFYALRKIR